VSDVGDLLDKYLTMRRLREERDRAVSANVPHTPPREMLRSISQRWPGVLAEIDRIAPDVLHDRIAVLEKVLETGGEPPLWARAWMLAHSRLRGALAIKFRLRGGRALGDPTTLPPESAPYLDRIGEIASPPNGRLVDLVFGEVAEMVGVEPSQMRTLLMPRP
jgi:hypothetical protein